MNENSIQCMTCKCDDGDQNIWTTRASENSDNQSNSCHNCETLKSGPLFISSKGIGWTSWKKRWFILSRKSLMFYRVDPNALPQKGSEAPNPTLGGIELNNSGSVIVKTDKKLLTVLFPDGRDGRAFTLKTETLDELNEWKAALEGALAQAPSANQVMGHSGLFLNEAADSIEAAFEQFKDKPPTTSSVIGRPVLLALEEIDGSPSFLEKAFRFIEEQGVKVEGILRQSADVEEVMQRVQEYEQGKTEFTADEDAHVIGDCIKHVLREMPSSPVPASCCMSLVDAYRTSRGSMVKNIRHAIYETFPEPNRRLLQRTLQMILNVAAHKAENRMSLPALAACMAPLLLRPLLAGECELNNGFQIDRDGSYQLLQAAAAANHAQAIVIVLLEKYKIIFNDESFSSELYTESEDEGIEGDESTDNEISKEAGYHDAQNDRKAEGDTDVSYSGTPSGSDNDVDSEDSSDLVGGVDSEVDSDVGSDIGSDVGSDKGRDVGNNIRSDAGNIGGNVVRNDAASDIERKLSIDQDIKDINAHSTSAGILSTVVTNKFGNIKPSSSSIIKSADQSNEAQPTMRNKWGRTSARKNLSVESIEYINDDESAVQRLESAKIDLQKQLSEEIKGNVVLQSSLDGRKQALHERRLALEKEVVRLKELLQKERDLRLHLESGLMSTQPDNLSTSACLDSKIMADLEEIALSLRDIDNLKLNIIDLAEQLQGRTTCCQSCGQPICRSDERLEDANIIPNEHKKDNSLKPSILLTAQRAKQTLKDEAKSNMKDEAKNSTFLKERQTYQNILPRISNHSVARYSETSLAEDRHSTSKKLLRWECSRKDALEPSSSRRVSAQQKQSIISSSKSEKSKEMDSSIFSEEQTTLLHNNATRRHASKSEEGISSSFALTKLTNRLNFLKERRAQLANEVQNLDSDRATGSEAPLKTNNN